MPIQHDPHSGRFMSSGGLASAAHAATAKAHSENTKESHEAAHKAHTAVLEHLSAHGDGLDRSRVHSLHAAEHKHMVAAHSSDGAEKLSHLAHAATAKAAIQKTVEAHTAASKAHQTAYKAHDKTGNVAQSDTHKIAMLEHQRHLGLHQKDPLAEYANNLSKNAKTPEEHLAAAKAHYQASNEKNIVSTDYHGHTIKAHEALEKLEKYPASENGHPVHPASWAEHHYGAYIAQLPQDQKDALSRYSDTKIFLATNRALREGKKPTKTVKVIDAALASAKTPEAITVSRSLSTLPPGMHTGAHFTDAGYMSTSLHHGGRPLTPISMEIHVPKGSPGLAIRGISAHKSEEEFLLPRNTKLKIDHIEVKDDKTHIKAAVVHD